GVVAAALLRARSTPPPRTLLGRRRSSLTRVLPAAVLTGAVVVLAAWVVGPRLPGATDPPLIDTSEQGGGVTEVLSPLVDIRSRLVNRSATELFSVTATAPAYWRATALPEFDGNTWGLPDRSLDDVQGELQQRLPGSVDNRQEIVIAGLGGPLVPAAAEPIAASGQDLRWNQDTSTLVRIDGPLATGDRIEVVSAVPVLTPDQLRAATSTAPPDAIYLDLPAGFPESVREQAQALTAGATTSYDKALTLQDWFRSQFTYSIEVPQGHGNDAIEAFLRQRVGYCEQFAGTFAAMARSLGIPSRVAVGFTPGLAQGDGSRTVLGRNAHAWPEVWFDGLGWVPFEPTPGRGSPGTESYTGVAPAQDESVPQPGEGAAEEEVAPPPITAAPPATVPPSDIVVPEPVFEPVMPPINATVPSAPVALYVLIAAAVVALVVIGTPEAVRRWRRRHPDPDPSVQLHHLWSRAIGAVEATGYRPNPSLTPIEQARAASPRLPVAARPLKSLAELTTQAVFSTATDVAQLKVPATFAEGGPRRWCRQVERIAADSMTAAGRVKRYFTVWH
ncbi:MAG: transglutaminaseTgpA domain-containing protein, partial [Ilumatobacteraceae bacterium]